MPDSPALSERPRLKDILHEVIANYAFAIPAIRSRRIRQGRTQNHLLDSANLFEHSFNNQFSVLQKVFGNDELRGKTFLELGPGDAVPVAFGALAIGATNYIACDRFPGTLNGPIARNIYDGVRKHCSPDLINALHQRGLDPDAFPWLPNPPGNPPVIQFHAVAAEALHTVVPPASVDVVYSYNVIEHVTDPEAVFASAFRILRPDGIMLHRIDFGPHGCWLNYRNPLLFMTISEPIWQAMGSNRGMPNRVRRPEILSALSRQGFTNETLAITTCDSAFAIATQPHLARAKNISLEELSILDTLVLSKKPA